MTSLLRRNPAVRSLPRWLIIAPLTVSMMEGVRTLLLMRGDATVDGPFAIPALLLTLSLWLPLAAYLAFGRVTQRSSQLDLGLPVSTRSLWRVHLLAAGLAGSSLVLTEALVIWLRRLLISSVAPPVASGSSGLAPVLLAVMAVLAACVVLLQLPDLSTYVNNPHGRSWRMALILAVGGLPAAHMLTVLPRFCSWLVVAAALAGALWLERRLPAAFTLVPLQAGPQGRPRHAADSMAAAVRSDSWAPPATRPGTLRRTLTILRVYFGGIAPGQLIRVPFTLVSLPITFVWGLMLAGLLIGQGAGLLFLTLSSYILFAFIPAQVAQLHILDPLPISRRLLFACLVLPTLAVLGLGYCTGVALKAMAEPTAVVEYQTNRSRLFPADKHTFAMPRVPLSACGIIWTGPVPTLTSPAGERHQAWSQTIYSNGGPRIYSPYATAEAASEEFVAHQLSRAIQDIYGTDIPAEEIRRRYMKEDAGSGTLVRGENTLLRDYPQIKSGMGQTRAPIYFTLITLLYLLMVSLYSRALRASVSDTGRKVVMFSLMGTVLALHMLQLTLAIAGILEIDLMSGAFEIGMVTLSAALPGGDLALWLLAGVISLGGYLLAERRFLRMEAPRSGPCSLAGQEY